MSSSFAPTQAELALVNQIFAQGDPQKLGILTGDVAVRIFGGAHLPPPVLGEIWGIADEDNNGWLSKKSCAQAVRLMGWAQKGEKVSKDLINKPGPIPSIDGVSAVAVHNTGMSIPRSPPPLPPFTPQDKAKFQSMFLKANPTNGILSGEQARDIFVKSKLPNDKLLQIWNLADTQDRGALDATDFAIGMYFIQGAMSGQIPMLPQSLPPGLYQQAGGGVRTNMTGNSPRQPSFQHIQPQYTGQSQMLQPQSTGRPTLPARPAANPSRIGSSVFSAWDVTAAEKAQSDTYFDKLDSNNLGYIEGDVAVPFMLESKLPGEILAQVWDLSDLNNDGRLTRDGFAVAMHLINKKLAGTEIPSSLPPSLIPPSMRANVNGTQEPPKDLFSFDETPPPSAPAFVPTADPFNTRDLLGDDDDEPAASPPLQDHSAEIGNIQNQLGSTNRSLQSTKSERESTEQALASQASQLSALQTQLSSAKAAFETETKLLSTLKDRYANQSAEIQKTREELIRSESDLSAVRVEKAEIEGAFLRDKEEARELHRKMVEAGQQAETLKAQVEKLKKDAKQQKGLLAIARKQLSSKEAERQKVEKELAEAKAEQEAATQERTEAEAQLEEPNGQVEMPVPKRADSLALAASTALPASPEPAPGKSNNPFERLAMSSPRAQSPFLPFANAPVPTPPTAIQDQPADDLFGFAKAFEGDATPKAAPATIEEPLASPTTTNATDDFTTPPTTSSGFMEPSPARQTTAETKFPDLDSAPMPGHFAETPVNEPSTDLTSSLKEIEDDSDSSDEEDEVPLAELAKQKAPEAHTSFDDAFGVSPSEKDAFGTPDKDAFGLQSTPDKDAFGVQSTPEKDAFGVQSTPEKDAFGVQSTPDKDAFGIQSTPEAGVNAFDEAMGKISAPASTTAPPSTTPQFSFDTAFEDNFDFASAGASPLPAVNGNGDASPAPPAPAPVAPASDGFESLFTQPSQPRSNTLGTSTQAPRAVSMFLPTQAETTSSNGPSFDEIFSGLGTGNQPSLTLAAEQQPTPSDSPTTSPPRANVSTRSMTPPPRAKSPKMTSPKNRPSTSSSKDEKREAPPTRTSKLSIRLPFGKKKKQEAPPPPPPASFLTPPTEEPTRNGSPAVEDDVEAVKQLTDMGFSRSQAIGALEKYGYDVPRALNSLLGQQ
ncbi:hypothetical protein VKT23_003929 [Stygiomarasmius scandens]|uniref:Uncharacterized protein n=1 Tax=Marasmiellus scandens TaxID=2682957 RepID=A0ABR1JX27_9AGAR